MNYGRVEYKYLLPLGQLDQFRAELLPHVTLDPYCAERPEKQYTVRSIYYDNRDLKMYHEKHAGLFGRKKVRLRAYNALQEPLQLFLEVKQKEGQTISKIRHPYKFNERHFLLQRRSTPGQLRFLESRDDTGGLPSFVNLIKRYRLRPVVSVSYEREAFFYRFEPELRITFDKHLRGRLTDTPFHLFEDNNLVPVLRNHIILEIKSRKEMPFWLRGMISKYKLRQQALSKYTMVLDANKRNRRYARAV